jgi:hypothetical protein
VSGKDINTHQDTFEAQDRGAAEEEGTAVVHVMDEYRFNEISSRMQQ